MNKKVRIGIFQMDAGSLSRFRSRGFDRAILFFYALNPASNRLYSTAKLALMKTKFSSPRPGMEIRTRSTTREQDVSFRHTPALMDE
ncbi:MAG: hypothetical protein U0U46_10155 [Saprospiraceae bacterium]|nr:hypothetical protein [Saprospiraceae bacterium]